MSPPGSVPSVASSAPPFAAAPVRRLLIVEDNPLVLEVFMTFLQRQGCRCDATNTGAAACDLARSQQPEVIVMDLQLPDGDGVSFVPELQRASPRSRIIAVSAHQLPKDRKRALDAGMAAFLVKPVELTALWEAVSGARAPAAVEPRSPRFSLRERFWKDLPAQRSALSSALAAGDLSRLVSLAHYLRNSAIVVELPELLALATTLETAARRNDGPATAEAWRRCDEALGALRLAP